MKKLAFLCVMALIGRGFSAPNLQKYLENDLELKRLAFELEKTMLSAREMKIDNGFSLKLSTGTLTLQSQGDNMNVNFTPSLTASIPQANNLGATVSSNIKIQNGENNTENTKISLSADIISGGRITRKVNLMKADRDVLEAKRSLQNRALEAEKEYYTELKNLFTAANSIITAQKNLYDDTIDFEEVKAKGYSKSSAKYRQAELKVFDDRHSVETAVRELEHDCAVFASKCGELFETGAKPEDFLPPKIEQVEIVAISSYKKDMYTKIESAKYTHEYNSLVREAKKNFTLSANAGYTFNNPSAKTTGVADIGGSTVDTISKNKTDTIDAGLTAGWNGLNMGAGVSFPVGADFSHLIYTISAVFNPNELLKARITKKKDACSEEEEFIAIQAAEDSYETSVVDQNQSLSDIVWSKQSNFEFYNMYVELERDMAEYLKAGVITESEYLNSYANKERYRINLLINDIDLIIYNNTTKLLFCRDEEIN